MRRRAALALLAGAPLAALSGCGRLSLEQGLMGACTSGIDPAAADLVAEAWQGLRADRVWDVHTHLFGNGRGGTGIHLEKALDHPTTVGGRVRLAFYANGGCVGEDPAHYDRKMVARLVRLLEDLPAGARVMVMAFDCPHDERGVRQKDLAAIIIPNDYARAIAQLHPQRMEWIASVHPYREDAVAELERCHAGGARAVKWLPPAMGIDLRSPRCVPFYEALRRLDLPLITHAGEEQAVAGARDHDAGNPLRLRHPLDQGVRVVAAHCATLGQSADTDHGGATHVDNFELFARLMGEKRYERLLFGDISAVTQVNRASALPKLLARQDWAGRLLNGSDYPLPGILPLFSPAALVAEGLLPMRALRPLRALRESNALLFDFVLKRTLRQGGASFPASTFETRDFFLRAA